MASNWTIKFMVQFDAKIIICYIDINYLKTLEYKMFCYCCKKEILRKGPILSGLHPECFIKWFGIKEEFKNIVVRKSYLGKEVFDKINSSFFHGKFRKYSGSLGGKNYILKVQQKDYPELPACEYLCNQIAQLLKIEVPPFYFIRFQNKLDTFVSKNFIQNIPNSSLIHIYHFIGDNSFNCETISQIIENKTNRLNDVEKFIQISLFDSLIGNHDRHGRNLALIQTPFGFQLAPAYDNPSYLAIEIEMLLGAIHEPKGTIATCHTNEPSLSDYVREWKRLKRSRVVDKFKALVLKSKSRIFQLINDSFMSNKRKKAFSALINRRIEELNE